MTTFANRYDLIQSSLFSAFSVKLGRTEESYGSELEALAAIFKHEYEAALVAVELFISRSNFGKKDAKTVSKNFSPLAQRLQGFRTYIAFKNPKGAEIRDRMKTEIIAAVSELQLPSQPKHLHQTRQKLLTELHDFVFYWEAFKVRTPQTV